MKCIEKSVYLVLILRVLSLKCFFLFNKKGVCFIIMLILSEFVFIILFELKIYIDVF